MKTFAILAAAAMLLLTARAQNWSVTSPNGAVKISIQLADLGGRADYPKGNRLYYKVEQGAEGNRVVALQDSPLGLQVAGKDLLNDLAFAAAQPVKTIDESYDLIHGKRQK